MKIVSWRDFKNAPNKSFGNGKRIRVTRQDGTFFVVTRYSPVVNDVGFERPKGVKKRVRCDLCGSLARSMFTVPFDLSFPPGYYCVKCRKKHDILDVQKAKRYGKIF